MAAQLDQLLAYLDRPGTIEITFCVGKPITMRNAKGLLNVTGRALGAEQLASIVRGTPLEAIIADDSIGEPVTVELGKREVTIEIVRGNDQPTVRIRTASEKRRPKSRVKPPSNRPATREEEKVEAPPPAVKPSRTRTAPRGADLPERPSRPSTPTPTAGHPVTTQTLMGRPSPLAPAPSMPQLEALPERPSPPAPSMPQLEALPERPSPPAPSMPQLEPPADLLALEPAPEPAPRAKSASAGPPGLALDFGDLGQSQSFDIELPPPIAPMPSTGSKPLRIDMRKMTEPPPLASDQSGIIALDRAPGMPLVHGGRTFETLGLPGDIATVIARDHGLVLITSPNGHGKTSTLGALFDRIDRTIAPHVVTIDTLRDRESIDLALATAEGGYFVLATLTAPSPAAAIETLLDSYPGMAHGRVKTRLASVLVALIAKRLPPTPSEIITGDALRNLL